MSKIFNWRHLASWSNAGRFIARVDNSRLLAAITSSWCYTVAGQTLCSPSHLSNGTHTRNRTRASPRALYAGAWHLRYYYNFYLLTDTWFQFRTCWNLWANHWWKMIMRMTLRCRIGRRALTYEFLVRCSCGRQTKGRRIQIRWMLHWLTAVVMVITGVALVTASCYPATVTQRDES